MKRFLLVGTAVVLVFALATSVSAQAKTDSFWIEMSASNEMLAGGGSGWDPYGNPDGTSGDWIAYPFAQDGKWWNQWFYDHPLDFTRWKEVSYDITLDPGPEPVPESLFVEVAINWSNDLYLATDHDKIPPDSFHEEWIGRKIIFSGGISVHTVLHDVGVRLPIPYNPEWVSIDVRYDDPNGGENLFVPGTITHDCVPEPSSLVLLGFGAAGLLALVWRRRS